jgi:hypothetical protein
MLARFVRADLKCRRDLVCFFSTMAVANRPGIVSMLERSDVDGSYLYARHKITRGPRYFIYALLAFRDASRPLR